MKLALVVAWVGIAFLTGCGQREVAASHAKGTKSGFCSLQSRTARGTALYVVECGESSKKDCLLAASACGGRVVGSASTNALLVETSLLALSRMRTNSCFAAVHELEPRQKVAEGFVSGEATVQTLTSADRDRILAYLAQQGVKGAEDHEGGRHALRACLTPELVSKLASRGEVRRIAP